MIGNASVAFFSNKDFRKIERQTICLFLMVSNYPDPGFAVMKAKRDLPAGRDAGAIFPPSLLCKEGMTTQG